jgi:translation initiation factor IF-3
MAQERTVVMNKDIKVKYATIIDETGKNLGSLSVREALSMAQAKKLDLVMLKDKPPLCKMMDYHKEQFKKAKAQKKPQEIEKKEIQFNAEIADHDLETHAAHYLKWASKGKVRVMVRVKMHGRWAARPELAIERFQKLVEIIGEVKIDKQPEVNGRDIIGYLKNY